MQATASASTPRAGLDRDVAYPGRARRCRRKMAPFGAHADWSLGRARRRRGCGGFSVLAGGSIHDRRRSCRWTGVTSLHRGRMPIGTAIRHLKKGRVGQGPRDRPEGRVGIRLLGARHRDIDRRGLRQRALLVSTRGSGPFPRIATSIARSPSCARPIKDRVSTAAIRLRLGQSCPRSRYRDSDRRTRLGASSARRLVSPVVVQHGERWMVQSASRPALGRPVAASPSDAGGRLCDQG